MGARARRATQTLCALGLATLAQLALAQESKRDDFYWLGQINKASAVINTEEGLLDKAAAPRIAKGLQSVLAAGDAPNGKRPSSVITFEPLLIEAAGVEATLLHAGRSSQDMLATVRSAIQRDNLLRLAQQLRQTRAQLLQLAQAHTSTIVPNYTNGVAAQPNSYGHYLLGHLAGFDRDAQRLHEAFARLDQSAMGTTVLNGTSWPLNRERMAKYLGYPATVDNAYDAAQILAAEMPAEIGAVASSIALHVGAFVEDVMVQYAQPRPWILLREGGGNTYVSSAMPQKRNPGLLNDTRVHASRVLTLGIGRLITQHNIPPGMSDSKPTRDSAAMVDTTLAMLQSFDRVLKGLVVSPERALEELNLDWTASQEVADVLMREHRLPFRVGHHFASEMVSFAKDRNIKPSDFPYAEAQRLYAATVKHEMQVENARFPMSESAFRAALDPVAIVRDRATAGGPQPREMARMIAQAQQRLAQEDQWIAERRGRIDAAQQQLDRDFARLAAQ
ncbi:argininosuccinate lyase [Comamonas endophytica]|uniref:argininosuccinate lyase n=1 Tax=Comamonas endophytica TaxID=2949090 RepID=UPI003612B26A